MTLLKEWISQVYAYDFEGERYDVGEKLGFVKTTIEFALKDQEMKVALTQFIKQLNLDEWFVIKLFYR